MNQALALDPAFFSHMPLCSATLSSRFVMPAMQRGWCRNGAPDRQLGDYYRRRVENGVGMIISESCAVDHISATAQPSAAWMTTLTQGHWAKCIAAVREAGGVMLIQLWHEGALRADDDGHTLSPSGLCTGSQRQGRQASAREIEEIADAFERSAVMAQDAGADGVEIHAAHGYLLDQFLWPLTNVRNDEFGGADIRDRARLLCSIITRIRGRCGAGFIISVRISQWKERDFEARIAPDRATLNQLAGDLREAGASVLHCSTRRFWEPEWENEGMGLAGWCKHLSGLPTITVGSVGLSRDVMESFSQDGEASSRIAYTVGELNRRFKAGEFDLVAVGRSLIADPEWVAKARERRWDDIEVFRKEHIAHIEPF